MRVVFLKYARLELDEAVIFYEIEQKGLGIKFKTEIKKAVKRILQYPEACPVEQGDIKRCLLHKFPYKILYSIEKEHILIIAIAHQHRKPNYWTYRKK